MCGMLLLRVGVVSSGFCLLMNGMLLVGLVVVGGL